MLQASPLPLRDATNDPSDAADDFQRLSSFYYSHDYEKNSKPSEVMDASASNYYAPNHEYTAASEDFEFEKINPSDIKKINKTLDEEASVESFNENKPNITQQQLSTHLKVANNQKFSKLLFSSPSAHVSSNGPSGPFKAIICHDCENSEGRNVGHSVSFSAIKSWNVGSSNAAKKLEQDANQTLKAAYVESDDVSRLKAPDKYFDAQANHDENQQIEMNDKVELFKIENLNPSVTEKPNVPINTWNYSHYPINSDNVKTTTTPKRPIFNDLLKVPYDVLNAPLAETPAPEPVQGTQIHINHQQKFNDTITSNYQHFQQFIQKNMPQHYQSTAMPEQNYEVDESVSLMTNGRAHGVQSTTARVSTHLEDNQHVPQQQEQDAKFGYVVEGRNFRKYRVEEKTADGFIVG